MEGNFKLISIVVFIILGLLGVLVFSGAIPIGKKEAKVVKTKLVLWGTIRGDIMEPLIGNFNAFDGTAEIKYVQKSPASFNENLLQAIASNTGPDLFFISDDVALDYASKIYVVPYTNYPVASFKSTFASAGEVFLIKEGVVALPLAIDPLVMYYNRSMLDTEGIVYPPENWDQLVALVPTLNKKDADGKLLKSAVAMGQFTNVAHAKEIITTLFMQTGNPITRQNDRGDFVSTLGDKQGNITVGQTLGFYTSFADPLQKFYSWNKLLSYSRDLFTSNNLAFYFGFASERASLVNTNPNLNFGVAPVPQLKNASFKSTGASVMGVAVSSYSRNLPAATAAAGSLALGGFASELNSRLGTAPARRDLLALKPVDEFNPVYYSSALYARTWLDPSYTETNTIFRAMVDKVLSNTDTADDAVVDASSRLNLLLKK